MRADAPFARLFARRSALRFARRAAPWFALRFARRSSAVCAIAGMAGVSGAASLLTSIREAEVTCCERR